MKKLLILGLTVILFAACQSAEQRYTTNSPEIDATKAFISSYETADWETWKGYYADTAKIYHNDWVTANTVAGVLESHQAILENFASYEFSKDPIFYEMVIDDDGEKWVNFWGEWNGTFKANNQQIKIPVHLSIQYVDGKVVEEYGFWDRTPLIDALTEIANANMDEEEPSTDF